LIDWTRYVTPATAAQLFLILLGLVRPEVAGQFEPLRCPSVPAMIRRKLEIPVLVEQSGPRLSSTR
jgi:hypothetical protein